jgi:transcriptional regulator with XRE-family HTH domain
MPANGDDDRSRTPQGVFGKALKHFRERAGLSLSQLAALSSYSTTVISKLENGRRPPAEGFPERMDAIPELNTEGWLTQWWEWLKDSARHAAYPGWFDRWPDFEAMAKMLRWYEPLILPGLVQTDQYARAVLRTRIGDTDEEISEMVAARLARQAILDKDKPPTFWIVLDEGTLRRPIGGPHVMREQLNRLAGLARRPNVVIQVIPLAVGAHEGLRAAGFIIADFADHPPVAYQDTMVRGVIIDDSDEVASLAFAWDTIKSAALPVAGSLEVIEEVAKTWT